MHINIGSGGATVNLGGQRLIPLEQSQRMVEEGVRLLNTYKAIDGSSIDTNPEPGKVQFSTPGRFGNETSVAHFAGDAYEGRLSINRDQRGDVLDRHYEFHREERDEVIITDYLPTFHKQEMNVYRIRNGAQGTVEHVVVD